MNTGGYRNGESTQRILNGMAAEIDRIKAERSITLSQKNQWVNRAITDLKARRHYDRQN